MQERDKIGVLRHSLIFSGLDDRELAALSRVAVEHKVEPGEFVFWEGDPPDWFYVVAEGRIKVVKHSSQGKDVIIGFFGPGEMFGEVAVFEDKPYPASAEAMDGLRVLAVKRDEFISFLSTNPSIALRIISILSSRLREAAGRLKDLAAERAEQRLARTLLMLEAKLGPTLPFTRQEIADMAGTTTETAIRVMSRLARGRIIRSTRGQIEIIDEKKLRLLADGPPGL